MADEPEVAVEVGKGRPPEEKRMPHARWELVVVEFTTAHNDKVIPHSLHPVNPNMVKFEVMDRNVPGSVYRGAKDPQTDYIVLRSTKVGQFHIRLYIPAHYEEEKLKKTTYVSTELSAYGPPTTGQVALWLNATTLYGVYELGKTQQHPQTAYRDQHFGVGSFRNLFARTHPNNDIAHKTVWAVADEVVMSDATRFALTTPITADVSASGANGLDTGSEGASRWYEFYAIAKDDGTLAGLLHRAKDWLLDQSQLVTNTSFAVRRATGPTDRIKLAQGFKTATTGLIEMVDIQVVRAGAVVGNVWLTLETDNAGSPSGTVLATSDKMNAATINNANQMIKFIFRTPVSLTATTQYHLVLQGDYTVSDTVNIAWNATVTAPYANGQVKSFDSGAWVASAYDFVFRIYVTENDTALTYPSGYTKSVLLVHVYNTAGSDFHRFVAHDKRVRYLLTAAQNADAYLVNNVAAPAATQLIGDSTMVPPVRLATVLGAFQLVTGGTINLAPTPNGYGLNGAPGTEGTQRYDVASSQVTPFETIAPSEYQSFYAYWLTGDLYFFILGYTW